MVIKRDYGWSTKILALGIVLGLPVLGLMLLDTSQTVQDPFYWYVGIVLIMLFPLAVAVNLLQYKGK